MAKCSIHCQDRSKERACKNGAFCQHRKRNCLNDYRGLKTLSPTIYCSQPRAPGYRNLHRDKNMTLGEDQCTNWLDHTPPNIFTLLSSIRSVPKSNHKSPTKSYRNRSGRSKQGYTHPGKRKIPISLNLPSMGPPPVGGVTPHWTRSDQTNSPAKALSISAMVSGTL